MAGCCKPAAQQARQLQNARMPMSEQPDSELGTRQPMADSPWISRRMPATEAAGAAMQAGRTFQYATGHTGPQAAGPPWPGQAGFSRPATSITWQPEHSLLILSCNESWRLPPEFPAQLKFRPPTERERRLTCATAALSRSRSSSLSMTTNVFCREQHLELRHISKVSVAPGGPGRRRATSPRRMPCRLPAAAARRAAKAIAAALPAGQAHPDALG